MNVICQLYLINGKYIYLKINLIYFKMSLDDESLLTVEEVEKALTEIENKYSPVKSPKRKDCFDGILTVLSKEFDSVGLSAIDLSQPIGKIFKQIVASARSLIQIHRRTISQMKDVNIDNRYKDTKSLELYKVIDDYKLKVSKCEEKNSILQNTIAALTAERKTIAKREIQLKEELERTKRFYLSKQNELHHHIKKLNKENQHLNEMLGNDINVHTSKDDVTLKLIRKYKANEEIYKSTIHTLQENNKDLLNEILNLKEERAMALCNSEENCP